MQHGQTLGAWQQTQQRAASIASNLPCLLQHGAGQSVLRQCCSAHVLVPSGEHTATHSGFQAGIQPAFLNIRVTCRAAYTKQRRAHVNDSFLQLHSTLSGKRCLCPKQLKSTADGAAPGMPSPQSSAASPL